MFNPAPNRPGLNTNNNTCNYYLIRDVLYVDQNVEYQVVHIDLTNVVGFVTYSRCRITRNSVKERFDYEERERARIGHEARLHN